MDLETAYKIIESCPGFDDETSAVGEAWQVVMQDHARLHQALVNILIVCNRPGSCDIKLSAIETLCETMVED